MTKEALPTRSSGARPVGERGRSLSPPTPDRSWIIKPGDKLLIFSACTAASLNVMKAEQVTEFVSRAMAKLTKMEEIARKEEK